jgi:hypothetical protein
MQDEKNRVSEVIVINLKRAASRRSYMTRQLKSERVKFSFFEATDGNLIDDEWVNKNVEHNYKLEYLSDKVACVNNGALACADSHRRVWKQILDKGRNSIFLILEDDCFIPKGSLRIVDLIADAMAKDGYAVILLYYTLHGELVLDGSAATSIGSTSTSTKELCRIYPYLQPTSNSLAYLVTVAGAAKLLSSQSELLTRNADAWDFDKVGLKAGIVHPLLFQTGDFPSAMQYGNFRADIRRWVWALMIRVPVIGNIARGMQKRRLDDMVKVK